MNRVIKLNSSYVKIFIVLLLSFALLLSSVNTTVKGEYNDVDKKQLIIVDKNGQEAIDNLYALIGVDETTNEELLNRVTHPSISTFSSSQLEFDFRSNTPQIIAINIDEATNNRIDLFSLIDRNAEVYFYGDNYKIEALLNQYKARQDTPRSKRVHEIEKGTLEESIETLSNKPPFENLVGFKNGELISSNRIRVVDENGNFIDPPTYTFIHSILSTQQENSFTPYSDYGSDTIVWSKMNMNDSFYANNQSGQSLLRGRLNVDLLLLKNVNSNDNPDYDYFYIRNNAEVTSANVGHMKNIEVEHSLPFAVDDILQWGPAATTTSGQITVGLPWSISWQFTAASESMKIVTDGGQTTDRVYWKLFKPGIFPFHNTEYTMPSPSRIQPGTAWSSWGSSLAAINVKNTAKLEYALSEYTLEISENVRYYY